jgi:predicted 3-demethylubiquinone-9 3-methyltransferase (glyoxalase superfamily)
VAVYISVFKNSRILNVAHYTDAGPRPADMVMTVDFELDGHRFAGINGGLGVTLDEAVSFPIDCADQLWRRVVMGLGVQRGWWAR